MTIHQSPNSKRRQQLTTFQSKQCLSTRKSATEVDNDGSDNEEEEQRDTGKCLQEIAADVARYDEAQIIALFTELHLVDEEKFLKI